MGNDDSNKIRFRVIGPVIKSSGLLPSTIVFLALFVVVSLVVAAAEPSVGGFGNAIWLTFQVVTTIGLGDYTCTSVVARVAAIVLSTYSIFYLALITGAVVSYCSERMKMRRDESIAHFIHQLEHLPELSKAELADISEKVKRFNHR